MSGPQSTNQKKTLLEKFQIPVSHLDFEYIKECKSSKEIERIVLILRSGEEGYYPDLLKCAENKLKELKPQSKCFRTEEPALTKERLGADSWNALNTEMKEFVHEIKDCSKQLRVKIENNDNNYKKLSIPPVRKTNSINLDKVKNENDKSEQKNPSQRIKSLEYDKWDKYDADTQALKIDLDEERNRQFVEIENKKNSKKCALIEEINTEVDNLSVMERKIIGQRHKEQGNDNFKVGEYDEAIAEYTKFIQIYPCAIGYNNRAMAFLKLNNNQKAISDCDNCLKIEPNNIKALLRKAQAYLNEDNSRDAYRTYLLIKEIDPQNVIAQNKILELTKKYPDMPPGNALRLQIEEINEKEDDKPLIKEDYSELIIPNKIIENKLPAFIKKFHPNQQKKKMNNRLKEEKQNSEVLKFFNESPRSNNVGAIIEEIFD